MSISETKKKPIIDKLNYLETQIDELKKILQDFIKHFNNYFMVKQQELEDYNGFLLKEEIEKLQKKKRLVMGLLTITLNRRQLKKPTIKILIPRHIVFISCRLLRIRK